MPVIARHQADVAAFPSRRHRAGSLRRHGRQLLASFWTEPADHHGTIPLTSSYPRSPFHNLPCRHPANLGRRRSGPQLPVKQSGLWWEFWHSRSTWAGGECRRMYNALGNDVFVNSGSRALAAIVPRCRQISHSDYPVLLGQASAWFQLLIRREYSSNAVVSCLLAMASRP